MWSETQLLRSYILSEKLGCNVYLKLENLQRAQSFKYRGISLFVQRRLAALGPKLHLVAASSGNAGVAVAQVAKDLGLKCTIFLPEGARPVVPLLELARADVRLGGENYGEALNQAQAFIKSNSETTCMVPAYDHPDIFEGHASLVEEISQQLPTGVKPDAMLCCVGGGGLLGGVIAGCEKVGWDDVPLVALETDGANNFYQSYLLNKLGDSEDKESLVGPFATVFKDEDHDVFLVRLSKISSRAASLGSVSPSGEVVSKALRRSGDVICVSVPDEASMHAALSFANDHKFLVEMATSTTLVAAYAPGLLMECILPPINKRKNIVFVVCGGIKISLDDMVEYKSILESTPATKTFRVQGKTVQIDVK